MNSANISIATVMLSTIPTCSYNFVLLDIPEWTERNQREKEKMQRETETLLSLEISIVTEDESPQSTKD